ncbi:hypothetical protein [Aeromonas hydrophila]|nr:hypothetical protein [Aeromonas hydrophila]
MRHAKTGVIDGGRRGGERLEALANVHRLVVTATEAAGLGE